MQFYSEAGVIMFHLCVLYRIKTSMHWFRMMAMAMYRRRQTLIRRKNVNQRAMMPKRPSEKRQTMVAVARHPAGMPKIASHILASFDSMMIFCFSCSDSSSSSSDDSDSSSSDGDSSSSSSDTSDSDSDSSSSSSSGSSSSDSE